MIHAKKIEDEENHGTALTLGSGVTIDDFWMLTNEPHLNKYGVYVNVDQEDLEAHKHSANPEEEEEKRPLPRRIIPTNEIPKFIDRFWAHSDLQKSEVKALVNLFFEFSKKHKGYMTKAQFKRFIFGTLDLPELLCERMFLIFDKNKDGFIDYQEWTHGLHIILVGSIHEQLKYCFLAYDIREVGYLDRNAILGWIKGTYFNLNPMTEVQQVEFYDNISTLVLEKFVNNKDDHITFRQYRTAVCDNPSLMQIIGVVLPETEVVWRLNDILFPRFYRSKHLLLFPRGDVPKNRDIKFDPSRLMKRYPQTEICYPPNFYKGADGKPVSKNAPAVVEAPVKAKPVKPNSTAAAAAGAEEEPAKGAAKGAANKEDKTKDATKDKPKKAAKEK